MQGLKYYGVVVFSAISFYFQGMYESSQGHVTKCDIFVCFHMQTDRL